MTERDSLLNERCVACRRDSPRVTEQEAEALGKLIPDWRTVEVDGVPRLERTFKTKTILRRLRSPSGSVSWPKSEGHHPVILTEARRVTVTWWTHAIRWLHRNDFIMAAKTDEIAPGSLAPPASSPGVGSESHE